jgi:hypothetical protein
MSATRSRPVAVIGVVSILAPKGGNYYRLTWVDPLEGPSRTTAGTTLEGARAKARAVDAKVARIATGGQMSTVTLAEVREDYLSSPEGRHRKTGEDWSPSYYRTARRVITRALAGFEQRRAYDTDRALLDRMRAQAGTQRTVQENTTHLRGFLEWGHVNHYFSAEQAALLPLGVPHIKPALAGTKAPKRARSAKRQGQTTAYIRDEDAPNRDRVIALRTEMTRIRPAWGALAPELAVGTGLRWGEQYQLTAHDLHLDTPHPCVEVNWQINVAAKANDQEGRRKLPKNEKVRTVAVPVTTFTGFPLLDELRKRRAQALREQRAGTNPEALLFPSATGNLFHHTVFHRTILKPAALAAGWPYTTWTRTITRRGKVTTTTCVSFGLTWHSLRHRYARFAVDVLKLEVAELMAMGGWDSAIVVLDRYYRSGQEHADSATGKITAYRAPAG